MTYSVRIAGQAGIGAAKAALLSTTAFLAVVSGAAHAQDAGTTFLEGITIYSANRTPTEAAKVGSSVEVLTEKDLEKHSQTFLKDYLARLPGLNFSQSGQPGTTTRINLRGADARYIRVLVDGIDISDPSSTTTETHYEHLLVGDVSRIEVLKGSQSTLYGGDAVAGVISIETKTASKPGFSHSGGVEGGSYETFKGAYTAGYAAQDGSNVSFTVQGIDTQGFSSASIGIEDDAYENLTFSGRGRYHLSDTVSVFFAARSLKARTEIDDIDSFSTAPEVDVVGDHTEVVQHAGRVGMDVSLLNGAFQNTFAVQGMRIERDFSQWYGDSFFEGERIKGEYKGVLTFNDQLGLLIGGDWEQTALENSNISYRPTADIAGAYAQLTAEPIDGLVLTAGGRVDEHSDFGRFNTYRLTAAYLLPGTETKIRGSVATGFRAPSLDQLFGGYPAFGLPYLGNPDLEPEESESWDVGIEQGFLNGRFTIGATYFELDTDNFITQVGSGATPADRGYQNVPGVTHRNGVELSAAALVADGIAVTAGYTYIEAETATGERLSYVPRHNFVVGVDLQPMDKVELNVTAKYVADVQEDHWLLGPVALDDYVLVGAKASYEFTPGWKAYVRGDNLLDEDYQTILGYSTAGLSVFGGVTMALPSD